MWGPFDSNPWLTHLVGAMLQHGHAPPGDPFGPGGPFSLPTPDANRELLSGAGFTEVEIEEIPGTMAYDSFDYYWDMQTAVAGPVSGIVRSLSDDERAAIKATLEPLVEPFRTADGRLELPSLALGVCAAE